MSRLPDLQLSCITLKLATVFQKTDLLSGSSVIIWRFSEQPFLWLNSGLVCKVALSWLLRCYVLRATLFVQDWTEKLI